MKIVGIASAVTAMALGCVSAAGTANAATLAGDTIHAYYIYPTDGSVYDDLGTFTAPGGGAIYVETYQVTGNQLIVTADSGGVDWLSATFNGLKFVDESGGPTITGLTLDGASNANGDGGAIASWTPHSFEVNLQGEAWGPSQQAIFDIHFGAGGVPEPATWAMMLLGVGMIGGGLRVSRRKDATALTAA